MEGIGNRPSGTPASGQGGSSGGSGSGSGSSGDWPGSGDYLYDYPEPDSGGGTASGGRAIVAQDLETLLMLGAHDIVWNGGRWAGVLEDPFAGTGDRSLPLAILDGNTAEKPDEQEPEPGWWELIYRGATESFLQVFLSLSPIERKYVLEGRWTRYQGNDFIQRDQTFDPYRVDSGGRTNLERMLKGDPPIGRDGRRVELHHMEQRDAGPIMEVTGTEHGLIKNPRPSTIDREKFAFLRKAYWIFRARQIMSGG